MSPTAIGDGHQFSEQDRRDKKIGARLIDQDRSFTR